MEVRVSPGRGGFTMIEVIICLAIIGVLTTMAVPPYLRMMQNAKKSEAQVGLGTLYMAENSFFTTYGAYANNIIQIGFNTDRIASGSQGPIYSIGFPIANCSNAPAIQPGGMVPGVFPAANNNPAAQISSNAPLYYAGGVNWKSVAGRIFPPVGVRRCLVADVSAAPFTFNPYDRFRASATGCVAPGCQSSSVITGLGTRPNPSQDAWTIDQARLLRNVFDGITY